jgi:GTP cyclohydrolase I
MHWRSVKDMQPVMTNSVVRGAFLENAALRREFLSLRKRDNDCSTDLWRTNQDNRYD